MPKHTRNTVDFKLKTAIGPGKEFLASEVPTLRAVIQKGILIKEEHLVQHEESRNQLTTFKLAEELASHVSEQWKKANEKFVEPVTIAKRSLVNKIKRSWESLIEAVNNKCTDSTTSERFQKLDQLFDICSCRHSVVLCGSSEIDCKGCPQRAHVLNCNCVHKIPKLELEWVYYQRIKCSEKSQLQIASSDRAENQKQLKSEKRKQLREVQRETKKKKEDDSACQHMSNMDIPELVDR